MSMTFSNKMRDVPVSFSLSVLDICEREANKFMCNEVGKEFSDLCAHQFPVEH